MNSFNFFLRIPTFKQFGDDLIFSYQELRLLFTHIIIVICFIELSVTYYSEKLIYFPNPNTSNIFSRDFIVDKMFNTSKNHLYDILFTTSP